MCECVFVCAHQWPAHRGESFCGAALTPVMADRLVTLYIATPFSWFTLASMPPPPSLFLSHSLSFSLRFFHFTLYSATLIFSPHKQPLKNSSAQQQTKIHDEGENTIAACACLFFQYVALKSFLIAAVAECVCVC